MDNTTAIKVLTEVLEVTVKRSGLFGLKDVTTINTALETINKMYEDYVSLSGNFVGSEVVSKEVETENN